MSGKAEKKIKLLILGESTVGKTALLNCFSGKEFVPTGASTGSCFYILYFFKKESMNVIWIEW